MAVKTVASTPCLLCQDFSSTLDSLRERGGTTPAACIVLWEGTGINEEGGKGNKRRGAELKQCGAERGVKDGGRTRLSTPFWGGGGTEGFMAERKKSVQQLYPHY